jgi:hypothetical protein
VSCAAKSLCTASVHALLRNERSTIRGFPCRLALLLAMAGVFCAPVRPQNQAAVTDLDAMKNLIATRPLRQIQDSIVRLCFTRILHGVSWQTQDLYLAGSKLVEKDSTFFLGPLLRGFYLSAVSTDRRGHDRAKRELERVIRLWPIKKYKPYRGNMDALISEQTAAGLSPDVQNMSYWTTYYYLQVNYQLSSEYLELNEARRAWEVTRDLMDENFAYDFYSLHRLSWMYYKYRYFKPGEEYPFLRNTMKENVRLAIDLSFEQQRKIRNYRAVKFSHPRFWIDEGSLSWYEGTATNIISIGYGVIWENDSSIAYFERIPYEFQIRNNGTYMYLEDINYRMAERQFELVGKAGNRPIEILSQPTAIESYKNMLIYMGNPEEAYAYLDDYPKKYQTDRGWSMIWTGAVNYWNGHLDESVTNLDLARGYPEVFGNISFNRTHYDMLARIQESITYSAQVSRIDFEPNLERGFFARIWNAVKRFVLKVYYAFLSFLYRHWAVDSYLQIEDRQEYLKVFYPENLADYFQTWSILRNLDPLWHLDKLRAARLNDKRPRAQKFYSLFEADLLHRIGDNEQALQVLSLGGKPLWETADTTYEKLLIAMAEDAQIAIADDEDQSAVPRHIVNLYRWYPQAVMLWGHSLPLRFSADDIARLNLSGKQNDFVNEMAEIIPDFNFDSDASRSVVSPVLHITAAAENGVLRFTYNVVLEGRTVASGSFQSEMTVKGRKALLTPADAAKRIAYGVFRIVPKENAGEAGA